VQARNQQASTPFAAEAMQSPTKPAEKPHTSQPVQNLSPLATANLLTLDVAVFDLGKPAAPHNSGPFLSIPSLAVRAQTVVGHSESGRLAKLSYSLDVASILLSTTPRQLEVHLSYVPAIDIDFDGR
jgi:hypothetical protein